MWTALLIVSLKTGNVTYFSTFKNRKICERQIKLLKKEMPLDPIKYVCVKDLTPLEE